MRALASGLCQGLLLALAARQGFWRRVFVAFLRLLRPGRVGLGHTGWTPSTDSENNLLTHPAAGFPRIRRIGALKCCMCCGRRQSTRMISAGWLCIQILTRGAVRKTQCKNCIAQVKLSPALHQNGDGLNRCRRHGHDQVAKQQPGNVTVLVHERTLSGSS